MARHVVITVDGGWGARRRWATVSFQTHREGPAPSGCPPPHVTECVVFMASSSSTPPFDHRPRSPSLLPLSVIGHSSRTSQFQDCHI